MVFASLLLASSTPAGAQTESRVIGKPPLIEIYPGSAPKSTLMALPRGEPRMSGEKQLELNVVYTDSAIYNPATGRKEKVRLRSYTGASVDPARPYVAPTIEVSPGDTVRITLHNKLPADPAARNLGATRTSRTASTAPTCIRTACG
jgi:FtsP/CotA-like multicopper oxidase with cupredoxin domain